MRFRFALIWAIPFSLGASEQGPESARKAPSPVILAQTTATHQSGSSLESPAVQRKEVFQANADWRPIHWQPARVLKGSALDFSGFLDAPAGRWGEAICRDGQIVYKNKPETPVRIYGVVVSHALPFLDKVRCEQLAEYLAACGYNGVRLHNYNFAKGVMKEIGSPEFAPEALDQLDYFFFCLRKRGIYYTFPLNAWGFFKPGDVKDVPEFRDRAFRFESNGLLPISPDLQRWFRTYALNLLCHSNPYTGFALRDDPALLSIELANEDSILAVLQQYPDLIPIYRNKCREHVTARLGREATPEEVENDLPRFALQVQETFCVSMKNFLREASVQKPLTDLNFRDNMVYAMPRSRLDYVDVHAYWALYKNLSGSKVGREPPYQQTWSNPNTVTWGSTLGAASARLFGKPYMSSEFNGCYATPYWIFTGPMEATLAGSQGWNGVFRCGLSAHPGRFFAETAGNRIETSACPLMMFSERIGALLFAQGEVEPLAFKLPLVLTREYLMKNLDLGGGPKYPASYQKLAFEYQLGTVVLDGHESLDEYPVVVAPPGMKLPEALSRKRVVLADATLAERAHEFAPIQQPRFELDGKSGSAKVITPRSEAFLIPGTVAQASGRCVQVTGNQSVSVCFAGSLDRRPLAQSNRVLALYLPDLKNTGTEVEYEQKPEGRVVVRNSGKLPLLVHQGRIKMTLQMKDRPLPQIWALRFDGERVAEIQARRTVDGISFDLQAITNPETFAAYEVVWN